MNPIYLDCNATTPIEPEVAEIIMKYTVEEFGNSGSRTHLMGQNAKKAVNKAREQIAAVVDADPSEVIFTSGATESDNLAILGLLPYGKKTNKKHIISTSIEHKAVLEPLQVAQEEGFEVTYVQPNSKGRINPDDIKANLRPDTLLVSVMHVNNETGVIQPLDEISKILKDHECIFHTDAAQGFGKELDFLINKRINLISISAHKIYSAKGVGALIKRSEPFIQNLLKPLTFGGGQEQGLRPGTLPTNLIAGFGLSGELALNNRKLRSSKCVNIQKIFINEINSKLKTSHINTDISNSIPTTINISFPNIDSETLILSLKNDYCISNGSACTSNKYLLSHVLKAQGISEDLIAGAIRISWSHFNSEDELISLAEGITRILKLSNCS